MTIENVTLFDTGWNGWTFRSWMPEGRLATAAVQPAAGYAGTSGVRFFADGQDDDGIFFLEKVFRPSAPVCSLAVSWFFARYDPAAPLGMWPRVAYVGEVRDLARPETQHEFDWLDGGTGLVPLGDKQWNVQHFVASVPELSEVQVSVGWKINWETERESYIDNLVVLGS